MDPDCRDAEIKTHSPQPRLRLTGETVLILLLAVSGSVHEESVGEVEGGWIYPPAP